MHQEAGQTKSSGLVGTRLQDFLVNLLEPRLGKEMIPGPLVDDRSLASLRLSHREQPVHRILFVGRSLGRDLDHPGGVESQNNLSVGPPRRHGNPAPRWGSSLSQLGLAPQAPAERLL
jgi:hypothetical protein